MEPIEQIGTELTDDQAPPDDSEAKLAQFFTDMKPKEGAEIGIYQLNESNKQDKGYLFGIEPGELSPHQLFTTVRDEYGPGLYEAIGREDIVRNEKKMNVIAFRHEFRVGPVGSRKFGTFNKQPAPAGHELTTTGIANPTPTDALAAAIESNNVLLRQLVEQRAAPSGNENLLEQLKLFASLRETLGGDGNTSGILSTIREVLELKREIVNDDPGGDDSMVSVARQFLPVINKAVDAMQTKPTPRGGTGEPAGPQEHPLAKLLRQYLPNAILAQAAGIEPSQVATLVLANVASSDKLRADLLAMLDNDDALAALAAIDPGVNKNPQWFNELIDIVVMELGPESDVERAEAQQDFADHLRETGEHPGGPTGEHIGRVFDDDDTVPPELSPDASPEDGETNQDAGDSAGSDPRKH